MTHHHQQREKILQSCYHKFYLPTAFHSAFQLLAQTATFAFIGKSGYTLAFANRIAHKGLHGETRAFRTEGAITTLGAFRTFTNIPGPGVRTANFAGFGVLIWCTPEERREPRNSDALMRVAVPRRRGPTGLRDLFRFCRNLWLYAPHSGLSVRARWGWYHYPRRALRASETPDGRLSKGLICRFLRLPSSTPCAVTFSANTQISLSEISVANTFALWYDKSQIRIFRR